MRSFRLLILLFVSLLCCTCAEDLTPDPEAFESHKDPLASTIMKRAEQLADIEWTPLKQVPSQNGFFEAGERIKGLPYSSVKEKEKFVGTFVSFYTFATAVSNPKSVLYTDNVRYSPYHGKNCSTYYGTVCSMSVNYVLGIPYTFTTSHYKQLEDFYLVYPQDIDAIQVGDILLEEAAHVVIVVDLVREKGEIAHVKILESAGVGTNITLYTKEVLYNRWRNSGWELLRYRNLGSLPASTEMSFNDYPYNTKFNSVVCCNRGDRAVYAEGEAIVLNNLDSKPHALTVWKDGELFDPIDMDTGDLLIQDLRPGIYTFAFSDQPDSRPSVEVLETDVGIDYDGDNVRVFYKSCNGTPRSVIISTITGAHKLVVPLTEEDRALGNKSVPVPASAEKLYVKVMFEGEYGYVCNEPVSI